jgi:hypothetical protein
MTSLDKPSRLSRFLEYARHPVIATATVIVVATVIAIFTLEQTYGRQSREELVKFMHLAREAKSQERIALAFVEMQPEHLTLRTLSSERWLVATPFYFGANNWLLYIDFAKGQVVAMRIRTIDGWQDHPEDAPADVGSPPQHEARSWSR